MLPPFRAFCCGKKMIQPVEWGKLHQKPLMFEYQTHFAAPDASNAAIFTSDSIADLKRRFVCGEASWLVPVLSWLLCWCWLQLSWPYLRLHAWTSLRSDQILVLVTGCTSKMHISSAKLWFLPGCLGNPTGTAVFPFVFVRAQMSHVQNCRQLILVFDGIHS